MTHALRTSEARSAVIAVHYPARLVWLTNVASESGLRIVGTACDTDGALNLVERFQPDVLITDFDFDCREDDVALLAKSRKIVPNIGLVSLLAQPTAELVAEAAAAGAGVCALAEADPADLAVAIRQLFHPVIFIAEDCLYGVRTFDGRGGKLPLTRREASVLSLVAHGFTNATIASKLACSEKTVKFHLSNIFRKLHVGNRTEASSWARENGLMLSAETRAERAPATVA